MTFKPVGSVTQADYTALERAIAKALAKEDGNKVHQAKVTWKARIPMVNKTIESKDPVRFLSVITNLQQKYPSLKIYIFKVVEE